MKKKSYVKADFPLEKIRKYLEPGPIVLVSSSWKNKNNIMTMGWYTVMEFSPALIGCFITSGNHSFRMIENSGECVINIPTVDMIDKVIGIGNTTGRDIDKFSQFQLTPDSSEFIKAPRIKECYASIECKVVDKRMLPKYNFFILEAVKAVVARSPRYPKTVHYRGKGIFMVSGRHIAFPKKFLPQNF